MARLGGSAGEVIQAAGCDPALPDMVTIWGSFICDRCGARGPIWLCDGETYQGRSTKNLLRFE
jgi:hypothetical protein